MKSGACAGLAGSEPGEAPTARAAEEQSPPGMKLNLQNLTVRFLSIPIQKLEKQQPV